MITREPLAGKGAAALFFVFATVLFLVVAGCSGEKKEAAKEAPAKEVAAGHPGEKGTMAMQQAAHAVRPALREVNLSEEVKKKWKEVHLQITDNVQQKTEIVTLQVGSTVKLDDEGERLSIEVFVPDYSIAEKRIESRSNEPNNPAVLVSLTQEGKTLSRGWVFKHFPEYNSFVNQRFHLVLVGPGKDLPPEMGPETKD
jgi:hypothetical protein